MRARALQLTLAEAVRAHARGARLLLDDEQARDEALRHEGRVEVRLQAWIAGLEIAPRLEQGIREAWSQLRALALLLMLVAALAGVGAASTALSGDAQINILWALVGLVALPTVLLVAWLLVMSLTAVGALLVRPGGSGVGRAVVWLIRAIAGFSTRDAERAEERRAATQGLLTTLATGATGRWMFATLTHGFWLLFALLALATCVLRMSFLQYDFVWETTLLSDATARSVLLAIAWLPQAMGFTVPDAALLEASRAGGEPAGREIWARFLLACLLVYSVLPRLLLLALSLLMTARSLRDRPLDLADPVFLPAVMQLQRSAQIRAPLGSPPPMEQPMPAMPERALGKGRYVALAAIELDQPEAWPPAMVDAVDLGHIDTRQTAQQALADLRDLPTAPRFVLVAGSMLRTPDRGNADLLAAFVQTASVPVWLLLTESALAAARGLDVEQRAADWRARARAAGIDRCLRMELTELAALGAERLQRRFTADEGGGT
jgi:hypothetical protein